jgi:hypothetical protein
MERRSALDLAFGRHGRLRALHWRSYQCALILSLSPSCVSLTSTPPTALETSSPQLFQLATQPLDQAQRAELEEIGARTLRGGEKADAVQPVQ